MVLLRSLIYGTAAHILPAPFDAERTTDALMEDGITLASLVPTMLARMLDAGLRRPPSLRAVLLGGAPADPALLTRAAAAGVPVAQTYGLTETCSQATTSVPGEPETAGWPLPRVEVELAGDGEILVSGPTVAGGGTVRTGDLGRFDEQGRLIVVGRKADTIVTGGENVAPAEVEAVLLAHPAVAEAGVFARPHPEWGEAVTARVVLRTGAHAAPEQLRAFCAEHLAGYQVPKAIELSAEPLARTASGKLLRREMR
jgi:O-succinylbenzoic acid--CoA ligase